MGAKKIKNKNTYLSPHSEISEVAVQVHCRFTSTETILTVRDGEPRTATSTFTQLLSSTRVYDQHFSLKGNRKGGIVWGAGFA